MAELIDYYSLLGVGPDAGASEVRDAFRTAAQAWHCDRWSGASEQHRAHAEEMMKRVNAAREVLRDPGRRAEYDRRLRARAGAPKITTDATTAGSPHGSDRERIVLACPHCDTEHALANPAGRWIRIRCERCAGTFVVLAAAVCLASMYRAIGTGTRQFLVLAQLADGAEELVTFIDSPSANLRRRDSFSIVYADNLPAAVYNHTVGSFWHLGRKPAAQRKAGALVGAGGDLAGVAAGVACWLLALFLVRPIIGDVFYIAAIVVATLVLAYRKRATAIPWLAAATLTAGAATFILAGRRTQVRPRH